MEVFKKALIGIGSAASVAETVKNAAETTFGFVFEKDPKIVVLLQGENKCGKTTIIETILEKDLKKELANQAQEYVFADMKFIDVASNDIFIKDIFFEKYREKKILLYLFDSREYEKHKYAIQYFQDKCENNDVILYVVGTYRDKVLNEDVKKIEKYIAEMCIENSQKSRVGVKIIDAKNREEIFEVLNQIRVQSGEDKLNVD